MGCVDAAPAGLGGVEKFVGHRQSSRPAAGTLGLLGAQPDGGEGGLDGVGGAQVDPVLGRVLEVGEQDLAVLEQLVGRLRVLGPVRLLEASMATSAASLFSAFMISCSAALAFDCRL